MIHEINEMLNIINIILFRFDRIMPKQMNNQWRIEMKDIK
jgi:hypothetical protein